MADNKHLWDWFWFSLNDDKTRLYIDFFGYIWTPKRKHANFIHLRFRSPKCYKRWYYKHIERIVKGSALYYGNWLLGMYDTNGYLTRYEGEVICL